MNEEANLLCEAINQLPKRRLKVKAAIDCIRILEEEHKMRWATCSFLHDLMDKDGSEFWGDQERANHASRMGYEARWLETAATMLPPLRALKESLSKKEE